MEARKEWPVVVEGVAMKKKKNSQKLLVVCLVEKRLFYLN
jgi:hypothetical protein